MVTTLNYVVAKREGGTPRPSQSVSGGGAETERGTFMITGEETGVRNRTESEKTQTSFEIAHIEGQMGSQR